jgi:hypothetical protein
VLGRSVPMLGRLTVPGRVLGRSAPMFGRFTPGAGFVKSPGLLIVPGSVDGRLVFPKVGRSDPPGRVIPAPVPMLGRFPNDGFEGKVDGREMFGRLAFVKLPAPPKDGRLAPAEPAPMFGMDGRELLGMDGRALPGRVAALPKVGPELFGRDILGRDMFMLGAAGRDMGMLGRAPPPPTFPIEGRAPPAPPPARPPPPPPARPPPRCASASDEARKPIAKPAKSVNTICFFETRIVTTPSLLLLF